MKKLAMMLLMMILIWGKMAIAEEKEVSFFEKSLHHTTEGMRYWYEEQGGFMGISGVPYSKTGCYHCHIQTCDQCHMEKLGGKMAFSVKKARSIETCKPCHGREDMTIQIDTQRNSLDVHFAAGMVCSDCHKGSDVHGDGTFYKSMREDGAVSAACTNCHTQGGENAPTFDTTKRAHKIHKEKLACPACHTYSTTNCYNCHFDRFLATGEKKGNSIPNKEWMLLVNFKGKVTTGNVQTLVGKGSTFIGYVPYHTHSVQAKGRSCEDCHMNEAVVSIKQGKKIQMVSYENGEVKFYKGVVPLMNEYLQWMFFDKKEDKWVPYESKGEPLVQYALWAEPITQEQFKKLSIPAKTKE